MTKNEFKNTCHKKYEELIISSNSEYREGLNKINPQDLDIYNIDFLREFTRNYVIDILSEIIPFSDDK